MFANLTKPWTASTFYINFPEEVGGGWKWGKTFHWRDYLHRGKKIETELWRFNSGIFENWNKLRFYKKLEEMEKSLNKYTAYMFT